MSGKFVAFQPNPRVVAFDPGHSIGVATWNDNYEPTGMFAVSQEQLDDLLPELATAEIWVIEEYRVRNSKFNHENSKVDTIQVIGDIKGWARRHGRIRIVEQRSADRLIGAKWAHIKVPKGHMPDDMSAFCHGYYYLRKNNLIKSKLLEK